MRRTTSFQAPEPIASSDRLAANAMEIERSAEVSPPVIEKRQSGSIDTFHELTSATREAPSFLTHNIGAKSKISLTMNWPRSKSRSIKRFNSISSTVGRLTSIWRGHVAGAQTPSPLPKTDRADFGWGFCDLEEANPK